MSTARPILFLDVDGVLNTKTTQAGAEGVRDCVLRSPYSDYSARGVVEVAKVAALLRCVQSCGAKIVVSSSWREAFAGAGDFAAAIGIVPPLASAPDIFHRSWRTGWKPSSHRCHEINWWLDDHPKVKRYAVIDDHKVFPEDWTGADHEVTTDSKHGVTNRDLGRVAGLLGKGEFADRDWFAEAA